MKHMELIATYCAVRHFEKLHSVKSSLTSF